MSVAWENMMEVLGSKLAPVIQKAADLLSGLFDQTSKGNRVIRVAIGAYRDYMEWLVRVFKTVGEAVGDFVKRNRREINTALEAFQNLGKAARYVFEQVLLPVIRAAIRAIVPILEGLRDTLSGLVRFITNVLTGRWSKAWDALVDIVKGVGKTLKSVVTGIADILFTAVKTIGGQIIKGIVAGLKGLANAVKNAIVNGVKGGINAAKDAVTDAASWSGNAIIGPFGDGVGKAVAPGLSHGRPRFGWRQPDGRRPGPRPVRRYRLEVRAADHVRHPPR